MKRKPGGDDSQDTIKSSDSSKNGDSSATFQQPTLMELGKNMVLTSTSTNDPVSSFQRIDWTANKRVYKHKVYTK